MPGATTLGSEDVRNLQGILKPKIEQLETNLDAEAKACLKLRVLPAAVAEKFLRAETECRKQILIQEVPPNQPNAD